MTRRADVRPLSAVPWPVTALLALALALQLGWQASRPAPRALPQALPAPPSLAALRLASLGEPIAASRLLMLYLQSHDDQAGVRIAWRQLDYGRIAGWLARALELDPRSQYPLLAASEVYGAVGDPADHLVAEHDLDLEADLWMALGKQFERFGNARLRVVEDAVLQTDTQLAIGFVVEG